MFPAASVARTLKSYVPSGSRPSAKLAGEAHGAQPETTVAPRSRRHSNVAPASPLNDQAGLLSLSGDEGAASMDGAAGAARSRT